MNNKKEYIPLLLACVFVLVTRFIGIEQFQSHWDGPQYSIALLNYSFLQETPAIPGYPLYIALGFLFKFLFVEPHFSVVLVSVFYSVVGVLAFYFAGKKFFNEGVGVAAASIFICSPVFWFLGITSNPYGAVGINSVLLALATFTLKEKKLSIIYPILFIYIIGFRPQDLIFTFPLFLYGLKLISYPKSILALLIFILGSFVWIYPASLNVGGPYNYFVLLYSSYVSAQSVIPLLDKFGVNLLVVLKGMYLAINFLPLIILFKGVKLVKGKKAIVFVLWILPPLIYNLLVRSDHAAHQVNFLAAFIILGAAALQLEFKKRFAFGFMVALVCGISLFTFFRVRDPDYTGRYIPQSYHYSELRKNDMTMKLKTDYIKAHYEPQDSIVFTDSDSWRPYMYHLPQYKVINLEGIYVTGDSFKCIQRSAFNYRFALSISCSMSYRLTDNVVNLVFVNGHIKSSWPSHRINLGNNQFLQLLKKRSNDLRYKYQSIGFNEIH